MGNNLLHRQVRYLLCCLLVTSRCFAEPIVWKIQSNKPKGSSLLKVEQQMMREIEQASQGELVFELRANNGFVNQRSAYNAVRTQEIDAMLMTPSYWAAADPVFAIIGDLVAAWNSPAQYRRWLEQAQGIQYLQRAYGRVGLVLIGYTIAPAESLIATRPIKDITDFKGMVMRAPPGMISDFFIRLGARPRNIAANKVLRALKLGRIQMADFSDLHVNNQLGAYQLAKFSNYPGFHSMPLYDFVVSDNTWNKLNFKQQLIVIKAAQNWQKNADKEALYSLEKAKVSVIQQNVTLHQWSHFQLLTARRQAVVVWDKYANKSAEAKKLIETLKHWLSKEGNID